MQNLPILWFSTSRSSLFFEFGEQSEKFLDLGTVTRPPCSIYARVNFFFFCFFFLGSFFYLLKTKSKNVNVHREKNKNTYTTENKGKKLSKGLDHVCVCVLCVCVCLKEWRRVYAAKDASSSAGKDNQGGEIESKGERKRERENIVSEKKRL